MQIVAPFLRAKEQQVALSLASKVLSRKDSFSGLEAPKSEQSALKFIWISGMSRRRDVTRNGRWKCSLDMGESGSINTGDGSSGMMFVWHSYTLKGATQAKQVRGKIVR